MNKQIEELALTDTDIARIYRNVYGAQRFSGIDREFARAISNHVLAELAKQSEPVGWFKYDKVSQCWHPQYEEYAATHGIEQDWKQLYAAPLPQADLVAEIDALNMRIVSEESNNIKNNGVIYELRHHLSAAQADNEQLMRVIDDIAWSRKPGDKRLPSAILLSIEKLAIDTVAAHKARQGIPRIVPHGECKQGKCANVTTGCVGECSMKSGPLSNMAWNGATTSAFQGKESQ